MNNDNFLIEDSDLELAQTVCNDIDNSNIRNRAVANVLAADLAKKYPLVRLDLYCNKNLTQQEINDLKVERFEHGLDIDITTSLPEYEMGVRIKSESIFTEDEVNKKYFGI